MDMLAPLTPEQPSGFWPRAKRRFKQRSMCIRQYAGVSQHYSRVVKTAFISRRNNTRRSVICRALNSYRIGPREMARVTRQDLDSPGK